jgi:hypothetical protein
MANFDISGVCDCTTAEFVKRLKSGSIIFKN